MRLCAVAAAILASAWASAAPAQSPPQQLLSPSTPSQAPSAGGSSSSPGASLATPDGGLSRGLPAGNTGGLPPSALGGTAGPVLPALGAIAASARFSRDGTAITSGLHWRVYADKPDPSGSFRLVREDRSASPTLNKLPFGDYIVHVSLGLANAAKRVQVRADTVREVFELPAGGVRFEGRVGDSKIAPGQISFDIYRGSQFGLGDKRPLASEIPSNDVVVLPEGTYHVVSNYGDGNAVMRYDFRVQAGKLSDATIKHRAAVITLKSVGERGGEALANTAWSVLTPGGDVIKESIGAFPTVVLAEGEYVAIARNEGKVFNQEFKVEPGFDREIELLAR